MNKTSNESAVKRKTGGRSARHSSRLAAVQALYQIEQTDDSCLDVIEQFVTYRLNSSKEDTQYFNPDVDFFKQIVCGVIENKSDLDLIIEENLSENWRLERIASVTRAIFRAASYELLKEELIPTPVIINEYIEIGKEFFEDSEAAFINSMLDVISKSLRPAS